MIQEEDSLNMLLKHYFGVSFADVSHNNECTALLQATAPYFSRQLTTIKEDIDRDQAFVSRIFPIVLGYILTSGEALADDTRRQIIQYILDLRQAGGGFLPKRIASRYVQLFSDQPEMTDIYTTAYALSTLELLGEPLPSLALQEVVNWLESQRVESGWFYQLMLGDTQEKFKFQNELSVQTMLALLMLNFYNKTNFLAFDVTRAAIVDFFPTSRYMGVVYQLLSSLRLLESSISVEISMSALNFVARHHQESSGGFYEYLFEETKIDEIAGQKQRFQHDYLESTISASYRALQILHFLGKNTYTSEWWAAHTDVVRRYFTSISLTSGGGFGSHIQIAKFPTPFGPVTTPLETLMVDCAPALLLTLDKLLL